MARSGAKRTALVLLFAGLAAGLVALNFYFDTWLRNEAAFARTVDARAADASIALANLSAAQAGYLATGQGPSYWTSRAADLGHAIDDALAELRSVSRSPDAASHFDAAEGALQDLTALDERARQDIASGQRFLASDLIFMDGLGASRRLAQELAAARDLEAAQSAARVAKIERWRLGANTGVLLAALGLLLLASRRGAQAAEPATESPALPGQPERPSTLSRMTPAAPVAPTRTDPLARPAAGGEPGVPKLADAAELCVDLGRVINANDLPVLLARAASVLDAKGLMLWIADGASGRLRPSLAYGYSEKVLQRLGTIEMEQDSATSIAFRTLQPQSISGLAGGPGAIAVPLVGPAGCIGVLAAELTGGAHHDARLALARMIAAQLSSLVAPAESAGAVREQA